MRFIRLAALVAAHLTTSVAVSLAVFLITGVQVEASELATAASDTAAIELTDAELPPDVRDEVAPPAPILRTGALEGVNDAGLAAAAKWFSGFTISGDVRVRYEGLFDDIAPGVAATSDRARGRFAVRLGLTKKINDRATFGFRLATGVGANPTSTFQSFDNVALGKALSIDQAYLDLVPLGSFPDLHLVLGKQTVPFTRTSLVFEKDVNLEGVSQTWQTSRWPWSFSATAGQYFLEDNGAPDDPYVLREQLGVAYAPAGDLGFRWAFDAGINHFVRPYTIDATAQSASNFAGARHATPAGFSVLDLSTSVGTRFLDRPVRLTGGYIKNLSAAVNTTTRTTEDQGWLADLTFGRVTEPGTWEIGGGYRSIEADATPGQFTESEFNSSRGNTGIKGWTVRGSYGLGKNLTLNASVVGTESVNTVAVPDRLKIEVNLVAKF